MHVIKPKYVRYEPSNTMWHFAGNSTSLPPETLARLLVQGVPSNYDELNRGPWPGSNVGMGGSNFDTLLSGFRVARGH